VQAVKYAKVQTPKVKLRTIFKSKWFILVAHSKTGHTCPVFKWLDKPRVFYTKDKYFYNLLCIKRSSLADHFKTRPETRC
jgi:hypothetical protein